jgi:hypothetical protein
MACKGICERYRATRDGPVGTQRYANGQKRCTQCEIYMMCEGLKCPCCNVRLRISSRHNYSKFKDSRKQSLEKQHAIVKTCYS